MATREGDGVSVGLQVSPDPYVPTWRNNDDGTRTRLAYAIKRNGIARLLFCSPENYKTMSVNGPVPEDCLSWAVVSIEENIGPFTMDLTVPAYQARLSLL